jgi:hypothetical protein
MKQPLWAVGIAIGLLTLLFAAFFAQINFIEQHTGASTGRTVAAVISAQRPLTANAAIHLIATVGTDPFTCGTQAKIKAKFGTKVYFCYTVRNTGALSFTHHTVNDRVVGTIWDNQPQTLLPGRILQTRPNPAGVDSSITVERSFINNANWLARGVLTATAGASTIVRAVGTSGLALTVGQSADCTANTSIVTQVGGRVYYCITLQNTSNLIGQTQQRLATGGAMGDYQRIVAPVGYQQFELTPYHHRGSDQRCHCHFIYANWREICRHRQKLGHYAQSQCCFGQNH